MSLARVYNVKKTRKEWTCSKCRKTIPVGSPAVNFAVGFRGRTQYRHDTPECRPKNSDRESSAVATVYAAQEDVDIESLDSLEDISDAVQQVVDALEEVASDYEQNEMYEVNEDLHERVDILESSASELGSWDASLDSEPERDDFASVEAFEEAHETWLNEVKETAQQAIDDAELP